MRRVDFVGVPGAGKSTLYRALRERRGRPNGAWMTPGEARLAIANRIAAEGSWRRRAAVLGLRVPRLREPLADHILASDAERALRADRSCAELIEAWESTLAEASLPPAERALALLAWVRRTAELALFMERLSGRAVVFDESYSKLACGTLALLESPLERVAALFRSGPAPAALVWFKDPEPKRVVTRLFRRLDGQRPRDRAGRIRFADRWWSDAELGEYVYRRMRYDVEAARVLQERGVPVHEVDAGDPLPRQADGVEAFFAGIMFADTNLASGGKR